MLELTNITKYYIYIKFNNFSTKHGIIKQIIVCYGGKFMSIELRKHNQEAYEKAKETIINSNRAAYIKSKASLQFSANSSIGVMWV